MPRPQFTLRALLVAMLVVGAFFGGAEFGARREQERLASEREEVKATRETLARGLGTIHQATEALSKQARDAASEHMARARMLNERERRLAEKAK